MMEMGEIVALMEITETKEMEEIEEEMREKGTQIPEMMEKLDDTGMKEMGMREMEMEMQT